MPKQNEEVHETRSSSPELMSSQMDGRALPTRKIDESTLSSARVTGSDESAMSIP
jgi:hypothetical protein